MDYFKKIKLDINELTLNLKKLSLKRKDYLHEQASNNDLEDLNA